MIFGHLALQFIQQAVQKSQHIRLDGAPFIKNELYILLAAPLLGFIAAILPALTAYRIDISKTLSKE